VIGNQLDIEVKNTVFDPNLSQSDPERKVHVHREGDTYYYKVWIYLEGNDLPYVDYVTYTLDETFSDRNRIVTRTPSNPNCQLVIWTWGLFTVTTTITDKRGYVYEVAHQLTYDKELPKESDKYTYEKEEALAARPTLISAR
jgi:hypothetical protein